jgi:fibronectin type 3 domain-containing protein
MIANSGGSILHGPDLFGFFQANQGLISSDNLHPNAAGYQAMRTQWANAMLTTVYNASPQPPAAPTGLIANPGYAQVSLSWTASPGATSYNVKRSTTNGSGYSTIASPSTTSYTNTGLTNGTTYYYVVSGVNGTGEGANSSQAGATPTATSLPLQINSGGPAVSPFIADTYFSAGSAATNYTGAIDTSAVTNAAPQAVYQSERYGTNTYTIPGLTSGASYTVRLHFCENYFTASGQRTFNVSINGSQVLTNFDIYATAGAAHKANIQQFSTTGNASGQVVVTLTTVTNNALSNGIEIIATSSIPPAPTGLTASSGNTQVSLAWNTSSGATSYNVKRSTANGGPYTTIASPTSTTYTNTGLTNGTTYYYVVSAVNANGESGNSSQASATPTVVVPAFPTGFAATAGNAQVSLTWNAATGATSYHIKRGTTSGSGYLTVASPTGTSYTDTGLTNGTTYYYVATSLNSAGESSDSGQIQATPMTSTTCGTDQCIIDMTPTVYIYNNEWGNPGGSFGTGSITVNSSTSWSTTYNFSDPTLWNVISYPAAVLGWQWGYRDSGTGLPVQLSSHTPINTTAAYTVSGTTVADIAYDCWIHTTNNPGTTHPSGELMIWEADYGGLNPGGTVYQGTVDGINWDMHTETVSGGGATWTYYAFMLHGSTNYDLGGATLNITDFTDWLVNQGLLSSSNWIDSIQFGLELNNTSNGTLNVTNYTCAVGSVSIPPAPSGLSASSGNAQASLSWTASSGATSYNVLRSTTSGSGYASIATGVTATSYTNTGLTNGTTYYFVVQAVNSAGTSGNSNQASATPTSGATLPIQINAGGPAVSPFAADADFSGGATFTNWTGTIDTSAVSNPAPQAVYQSERYGAMTYTIPGLTANAPYTVRLHFCENYFTASAQRVFNVTINGTQVLTNFDIFSTVGAAHKANIQQFGATANGSGQIVIGFVNVTNNALINGIEVNNAAPAAPTNLTATSGNAQVALSWTASSGATSYNVLRSTASGSGYASVATGISGTSYTNTGLTNGTTYYYVVTATNANGTSGNSNEASGTPTGGGSDTAQYNFESGVQGWVVAAAPATAVAQSTAQHYAGSDSLAVTINGASGCGDVNVANPGVGAGQVITYHVWLPTGFPQNEMQPYVVDNNNAWDGGGVVATTGQWSTVTLTVPSNAALPIKTLGIQFCTTATWNGTVYLDSVSWPTGSAPAAPTGLNATGGNGQVSLSWTASSGATSYSVLRSTVSGSGYAFVASGISTTSYTNTGLTNGVTYYFVATATNANGTSGNSNQASATTSGDSAQYNFESGVQGWAATGGITSGVATSTVQKYAGNQSLAVSFNGTAAGTADVRVPTPSVPDGSTVTYHIWIPSGSTITDVKPYVTGGTWSGNFYGTISTNTWMTIATTVQSGTAPDTYLGIQIDTNGAWTGTVYIDAVSWPAGSAPAAPTGLAAVPTDTQNALSWNASSGATSYNVYRGTSAGGESGTAIATGISGTTYTNTGLTDGTTYYYTVKAVNGVGTSGASNEASGAPAEFNFESGLQGWSFKTAPATGAAQSTTQYFGATHSLALTINGAAGKGYAYLASPSTPAGKTVTFHVWVPSGSQLTGVQPYVMDQAWAWTGTFVAIGNLTVNAWNTITVTVPSGAAMPLNEMGVEFDTGATWSGTCYVDSISW